MSSDSKPRIGIFIPSLRGGGAERAMLLFAEGARDQGYEVDLILAQKQGALIAELPEGVNVVDLQKKRVILALPALIAYLKRRRPSALFSTIIHANIIATLAARLSGVSLKVIIRESNAVKSQTHQGLNAKIVRLLLPWVYPLADGVISVSDGAAEELLSLNRNLKTKIRVLPTPVISKRFESMSKEDVSHPWLNGAEIPCILAIGRLHPQKDFLSLLRATAKVLEQREVRLIILGEGNLRADLEQEAERLKIANKVSLPGFVQNPFSYLRHAEVFVLSSRYEGMPNVLIQAMASGTRVVATDCPSGPREVLQGGKLGLLTPVGDVEKLAQSILLALSQSRTFAAADYAVQTYGVETAAKNYLEMCTPGAFA